MMNVLFWNPNLRLSGNNGLRLRQLESIPASGATLLFASTLTTSEPENSPSSFWLTLSQLLHTLQVGEISYTSAPQPTPWVRPRYLQVPSLPDPIFETPSPSKTFFPQLDQHKLSQSFPLMAEVQEEEEKALQTGLQIDVGGVLCQDPSGMIYLEIASHQTDSLIADEAVEKTLPAIPVILASEIEERSGWGAVKEVGKKISVTITGLYTQKSTLFPELGQVWFCTLQAPLLESIREHYRHPGRRHFYLPLGLKNQKKNKSESSPLYRLNVSCFAA